MFLYEVVLRFVRSHDYSLQLMKSKKCQMSEHYMRTSKEPVKRTSKRMFNRGKLWLKRPLGVLVTNPSQ